MIKLGGIYATLHCKMPDFIEKTKKFKVVVQVGLDNNAENHLPDYSLLNEPLDYHITHAMRGCIRKCAFCGTWKLEPKLTHRTSIELLNELTKVGKNRVVFFDNNFFANPNIKEILIDLASLKINKRPVLFECQSGFDGRLLEEEPELAILLKKARFSNIKIAWDNGFEDRHSIKKQIDILVNAGYSAKEIAIFMIYNFNIPYAKMIQKVECCKSWNVQVIDCRYRPLTSTYDNYKPSAFKEGQTKEDYYIHENGGWTDQKIRNFRKKVRHHNMEIRYANGKSYDQNMEKWSAIHHTYKFFRLGRPPFLEKIILNKSLQKRVQLLNRLKNYYKSNNIAPPNLSDCSIKEIDNLLNTCGEYTVNK